VLRELDGLKAGSVGHLARDALRRLHAELTASADLMWDHKRVVAQAAHESCHSVGLPPSFSQAVNVVNNDDRILDCALWYKQRYSTSCEVLLVTEDLGLLCKALANSVAAKKLPELLATLPPVHERGGLAKNTNCFEPRGGDAAATTAAEPEFSLASSPPVTAPGTPTNEMVEEPELTEVESSSGDASLLPASLWQEVFGFCHPRDLARVSQVSRAFHGLSGENSVWLRSVRRMLGEKLDQDDDGNQGENEDTDLQLHLLGRLRGSQLVPKDQHARDWYQWWRRSILPVGVTG
jgi:PIN domain/F-box-like